MIVTDDLPGADWIQQGLADLAQGFETPAAFALQAAALRLEALGLDLPDYPEDRPEPELALYEALRREAGDAYLRYNSMRRQLDSCIEAMEGRQRRQRALP